MEDAMRVILEYWRGELWFVLLFAVVSGVGLWLTLAGARG
jgi:hypothetical protein